MRRAGRTDANQRRIVDLYRFAGCSVGITSGAGDGLPDLIVGRAGRNFLIELKDGSKPPSARRLTEAERYFVEHWTGDPVAIVVDDLSALLAVGFTVAEAEGLIEAYDRPRGVRRAQEVGA